jgi:hypothetical protein
MYWCDKEKWPVFVVVDFSVAAEAKPLIYGWLCSKGSVCAADGVGIEGGAVGVVKVQRSRRKGDGSNGIES